jgi:hypothetical protein
MATTRDDLHRLIDQLPDSALDRAARVLQSEAEVQRRFEELLAKAPVDDEPVTDEDRAALAEGEAEIAAGRGVRLEDLPSPSQRTRRRRRPPHQ